MEPPDTDQQPPGPLQRTGKGKDPFMAAQVQHQDSVQKPRESWEEAIWRLAAEAERHGVLIYRHDNGQGCVRYFATSQSDPGTLHYVTAVSCDCAGFVHHGRCRHLAALLQHTGNLPPRDDPPAVADGADVVTAERCVNCFGSGTVGEDDRWCGACSQCGGTGTVTIHWGSLAPATIPAA